MKGLNFNKPKKTKLFWLYIVAGVLLIIAALLFAPIWNWWGDCPWKTWGTQIISILIGAILLVYIFGYLLKKIMHGRAGTTKVLTIVEFTLLFLVALGCILAQFKIINVAGASQVLGLALVCRGVVEAIRGYYYRHESGSTYRYPLWYFCVVLAMIIFGTYCFASSVIKDTAILWIFVICILLAGILFIVYGTLAKPKSTKEKTSKKENTKKEKTKKEKKSESNKK